MKAVGVFPVTRQVAMVRHPEPSLRHPSDAKLRMLEVGVCGTDRALCAFELGWPPPGDDYFVLGHEGLAEVVEAGESALRVGDLVVPMVRKPCTEPGCAACDFGRQDLCASGAYTERGIKSLHGFMTEFVVEQAAYLRVVPRELREVAVLIEPLTIAEKALDTFCALDTRLPWAKFTRNAVVLGAGPVGLLGAMLLVHLGFRTWVYSRERHDDSRASIAEAIGARYACSLEVAPAELAVSTGAIDLVYEALGAAQPAFDILRHLGPNGVFVFTGVPARDAVLQLDLHEWMLRMILHNQVVAGTVNAGPAAFDDAVGHLAAFERRWPGPLRRLISSRFPIDSFRDAVFGDGIKNVIVL